MKKSYDNLNRHRKNIKFKNVKLLIKNKKFKRNKLKNEKKVEMAQMSIN